MALINIDKLKNSFDPNLLAHPVCFDLAKTWTIFNPLKKFSPNTLASRKARAAPLDQIFFFHHMQNICFEWTTWK